MRTLNNSLIFAIIAGLIGIPVVYSGLLSDDYIHQYFLKEIDSFLSLIKIFFDYTNAKVMSNLGVSKPWWWQEDVTFRTFRPIAAFTHWLDHKLWPESTFVMHAHNIMWYMLAVIITTLFYAKTIPNKKIYYLTSFLFVVDFRHYAAVSWIANRNSTQALFFGICTLLCQRYADTLNSKKIQITAFASFIMSLLSADAGIATLAYIIAYMICLSSQNMKIKIKTVLIYLGITLVWRLLLYYNNLYPNNNPLYMDPGLHPLQFMISLPKRLILLLFLQFIPLNGYSIFNPNIVNSYVFCIGSVFIITVLIIFYPLLKQYSIVKFFSLGMLLSLIPITAISHLDVRLLSFVGFGAAGLLAHIIIGLFDKDVWAIKQSNLWKFSAWTLNVYFCFTNIIISIIIWGFLDLLCFTPIIDNTFKYSYYHLNNIINVKNKQMIIVNSIIPQELIYLPAYYKYNKLPFPSKFNILVPAFSTIEITRIDNKSLLIKPHGGYSVTPNTACKFLAKAPIISNILYQSIHFPLGLSDNKTKFKVADKFTTPQFEAEILSISNEHMPKEVIFKFANPLENEYYLWMYWDWKNKQYMQLSLPKIGEKFFIDGPF